MNNNESSNMSNADSADQSLFWEDPSKYFGDSYTKSQSVPRDELNALQLAGVQKRFNQLRGQIPYLEKLVEHQGIQTIDELDDVIPLLFPHSIYKSYPPRLLAEHQFTQINYWLNKLTAHDITAIDVSGCDRIDYWAAVMLDQCEVVPWVSSGTSGIMSFIPHSRDECDRFARTYKMNYMQQFGDDPQTAMASELHEIWPYFRHPAGGMYLDFELRVKYIMGGDESRLHALYPGQNSLDVRYLQAQMRLAEKRGELGAFEAPPDLLKLKQEFDQLEKDMPKHLDRFLAECTEELQGKRIFMTGTWPLMYSMAAQGLAAGREKVFTPDSRIFAGGGRKGTTLPDNWREDVCRFAGVEKLDGLYGMTEGLARNIKCDHGNIHFCPWFIPFLLDPDTSKPIPREGRVTGRFAFFDLLANSHWGGLVTGDKLTIDWSEPCACGQSTHYMIGDEAQRYADERGGKDDLLPTATPIAHEAAMAFLTDFGR